MSDIIGNIQPWIASVVFHAITFDPNEGNDDNNDNTKKQKLDRKTQLAQILQPPQPIIHDTTDQGQVLYYRLYLSDGTHYIAAYIPSTETHDCQIKIQSLVKGSLVRLRCKHWCVSLTYLMGHDSSSHCKGMMMRNHNLRGGGGGDDLDSFCLVLYNQELNYCPERVILDDMSPDAMKKKTESNGGTGISSRSSNRPCIECIGCEGMGIVGAPMDVHSDVDVRRALVAIPSSIQRCRQIIDCLNYSLKTDAMEEKKKERGQGTSIMQRTFPTRYIPSGDLISLASFDLYPNKQCMKILSDLDDCFEEIMMKYKANNNKGESKKVQAEQEMVVDDEDVVILDQYMSTEDFLSDNLGNNSNGETKKVQTEQEVAVDDEDVVILDPHMSTEDFLSDNLGNNSNGETKKVQTEQEVAVDDEDVVILDPHMSTEDFLSDNLGTQQQQQQQGDTKWSREDSPCGLLWSPTASSCGNVARTPQSMLLSTQPSSVVRGITEMLDDDSSSCQDQDDGDDEVESESHDERGKYEIKDKQPRGETTSSCQEIVIPNHDFAASSPQDDSDDDNYNFEHGNSHSQLETQQPYYSCSRLLSNKLIHGDKELSLVAGDDTQEITGDLETQPSHGKFAMHKKNHADISRQHTARTSEKWNQTRKQVDHITGDLETQPSHGKFAMHKKNHADISRQHTARTSEKRNQTRKQVDHGSQVELQHLPQHSFQSSNNNSISSIGSYPSLSTQTQDSTKNAGGRSFSLADLFGKKKKTLENGKAPPPRNDVTKRRKTEKNSVERFRILDWMYE